MPKFLLVALVVFPCLAFAQAPTEQPEPTGILGADGPNAPRLMTQGSLSHQDFGTAVTTVAPPDPFARVRRGFLMALGGVAGTVVTGGLVGGGAALLCQSDYCGIAAIILGLMAGAVGMPLGAWLTGTFLADGDGNILAAFAGTAFGLLVTLPLHAAFTYSGHPAILALNVVVPLLGAILFYEASSNVSASATRALQVADVSLLPSATRDSTGALAPALALSGRFH